MAQEIADSKLIDTWSSDGLKVKPDISKIIEGWQLGEQPPHEYMNWLQNTFGSKLNHILKNGVASWNNTTQYLAGSSVQHNGNVWLCKTTNTNSEPTDANANWKRIITVESLADLSNDYVATTGNQTIGGVKTFTDRPSFLSPNIGTSGAVGLIDAPGNPDSVYIQALNNERNAQYGFLKFNKDGTIKPSGNLVGNAETATKLANAKTINSVAFDGSANISVGLDAQSGLLTASFTLNSTHKNKLLVCTGPFTISLPNTALKSGDLFIMSNSGTGPILLDINGNNWDLSRSSILPGETLIIQDDGSGASSFYRFVSRSKDFASNMNPGAGFTYLSNGMLMQWGYGIDINISPNMGALDITFPIAFPSGVFFSDVAVVDTNVNNQINTPFCVATSTTNLHIVNNDVDSAITQIRWFSIGY